jgi:hypothetical protein
MALQEAAMMGQIKQESRESRKQFSLKQTESQISVS